MSIENDKIFQGFIEKSLEHLADIEDDLLAIEGTEADIDVDLVNKVFRATHFIKGGAGFMRLAGIKNLAHAAENVLGLIRSEKRVPTPHITNMLLQVFEELQQLIENMDNSNTIQIEECLTALNAIYEGKEVPSVVKSASELDDNSKSATVEEVDRDCSLGWLMNTWSSMICPAHKGIKRLQ